MNSPATALLWEIWRKNRWGFALLLVLFSVCAGLSLCVGHLAEIKRVADASPPRSGASIILVRPGSGSAGNQVTGLNGPLVELNLGSKVIFQGPLTNSVFWSTVPSRTNWIRLTMGTRSLFEGSLAPDTLLHWATFDAGRVDGGSYVLNPRRSQEAARAIATVERWQRAVPGWGFQILVNWQETGLPWSSVLLAFSVYVVFAIFGCADPHAARGFTGIPPRRFALPVRTSTLVVWPIASGCATLLLLFFAWSRLVLTPLLPAGMTMPEFYLVMLLLAGLAVFQALVWGLPSFPKTRAVLIILLVLGLSPLAVLSFSMPTAGGEWPERWSNWQPNLTQLFAVAWVGGVGAAWFGVRQERRGGWAGWQRPSRIADFIREWTPHPLAFLSPLHAQLWIEWRRNCRLQLGVWMLVVGICLGVACLLGRSSGQFFFSGVGDAIDFLKSVGLVACLAIMGLNLARDGSSKKLALSSFTATRPIRTGDLLTAKLLAGVATWILAVSILAVATVLVAAVTAPLNDQFWVELNRGQNLGTIVFVLAFALHVFCGILPLSLSGRIPGFPWSLLPLLLIYGALLNAFDWFNRHNQWFGLLFILLVAAAILKLLVAVWGFRRALGLRLVSARFVVGYVILWLFGAGVLTALAWMLVFSASFGAEPVFLLPAAILVLPLARIALSPLALAMNRHR